jgi:hypothetical protein
MPVLLLLFSGLQFCLLSATCSLSSHQACIFKDLSDDGPNMQLPARFGGLLRQQI